MSKTRNTRPETFVSTLVLNGTVFILHFTETDEGYTIACINDKTVEPMSISKLDGAWALKGVPGVIRPLMTEKVSKLVEEYLRRRG